MHTRAEEQDKYIVKLRTKINNLSKGSKEWWKLNRLLLSKQRKCSSIPPLRDGTKWLNEPKDKANLFAQIFDKEAQLPAENVDCPFFGRADIELEEIVVLRSRRALKLLASLDESKATGPDHIPASILKRIAKEIAVPFTSCVDDYFRRLVGRRSGVCMSSARFTNEVLLSCREIIVGFI